MPEVFLSCVSSDFKEIRPRLAGYLSQAGWKVEYQENFHQSAVGTLEKLNGYIEKCDYVVHFMGESKGSASSALEITALKEHVKGPKGDNPLLANQPEVLRSAVQESKGITYTEWEAYLALHHKKGLLSYLQTGNSAKSWEDHISRLEQADPHRYPEEFTDQLDLFMKILIDLGRNHNELMPGNYLDLEKIPRFSLKPKGIGSGMLLILTVVLLFGSGLALTKAFELYPLTDYTLREIPPKYAILPFFTILSFGLYYLSLKLGEIWNRSQFRKLYMKPGATP